MKAIALFIVLFTIATLQHLQAQNSIADKAREQMKYGAYAQATDTWGRALAMEATNHAYFFQRGLCHLKLNRSSNALQDFSKAVELASDNHEYLFHQGFTYFEQGEYAAAKSPLEKAAKLAPQNIDYFLYKVRNLEVAVNTRAAIEDCRKMLRNGDTDNPNQEVLAFRALLYQKQGDKDLAERDIKQALKTNSENARFYGFLGQYYNNQNNQAQALSAYTKAHELDKTNLLYIFEEAQILLQIGSHRSCLQKSTKLMQLPNAKILSPKGFVLKAVSALLLNENNMYETAMKDFASVAKTENEYVFAAQTLATLEVEHIEGLKQAKEWAMKATGFSDNYANNLLLAQIYFKLDETTRAAEVAKKANELLPTKKGNEQDKKQVIDLLTRIEASSSDKTPPVLTIFSPVATRGGVIIEDASEIIIVTGLARDESGITKVLINGNLAKLDSEGNFEGKTPLKNDQTKIFIQAFDKRGNVGETFFDVEKKKTPLPATPKEPKVADLEKVQVGKCYALLIGNNNYANWSQLYNPIHDAKTLAKDLEAIYGFIVEVIENCTQEEFELKIREYIGKDYADNDQFLIFYAGHGHFDQTVRKGALVMTDSEYKGNTMKSYITHDHLRSLINAIPCKHTLYIADACFGGTIDKAIESRGARDDIFKNRQDFINRIMTYETRRYITSGGKEYVPDGKPGGHSPFMRKLLAAIRSEGGKDGMLTLEELESYLIDIKPTPVWGELDKNEPGSNFVFVRK